MRETPPRASNDVRLHGMCVALSPEAVNVVNVCESGIQTCPEFSKSDRVTEGSPLCDLKPSTPTSDVCNVLYDNSYVKSDVKTCESGSQCDILTFSPRLCEKLLPNLSDDQVNVEFKYLQLVNNKYNVNTKKRKILNKLQGQNALDLNCSFENLGNMSEYIISCERLIHSFSCEYQTTENRLLQLNHDLKKAADYIDHITSKKVDQPTTDTVSVSNSNFIDNNAPINFLDFSVENININDVMNNITFEQLANREVAYYGSTAYTYSGKTHLPKQYPDLPFFDAIFSKISQHDNNFSRHEYTCLMTLYRDGQANIPHHSDNEKCIQADSSIYCVSVGAERTLQLKSISQPDDTRDFNLSHGSIYSMSVKSQNSWQHAILAGY